EGAGNVLGTTVDGQPRDVPAKGELAWDAGITAAKSLKSRGSAVIELGDAANFEKDQAFSCGAWIKLPRKGMSGAIAARIDEAQSYRGWDLFLDNGRLESHLVHQWPSDAIKIIGKTVLEADKWYFVALSYDGSSKGAGVKLFVDGKEEGVDLAANALAGSIR